MKLSGLHLHNLKHLTLQIEPGKITNLCGPCGSGKSSVVVGTLARRGFELEQFLERLAVGAAPLYQDDLRLDAGTALPRSVLIDAALDFPANTPVALAALGSALLFELFCLNGDYECPACAQAGRHTVLQRWTPKRFLSRCAELTDANEIIVGITAERAEIPRLMGLGLRALEPQPAQAHIDQLPELVLDRFAATADHAERACEAFRSAQQLGALGLTVRSAAPDHRALLPSVNLHKFCPCCGTKRALTSAGELHSAIVGRAEPLRFCSYGGLALDALLKLPVRDAAAALQAPSLAGAPHLAALQAPIEALLAWKLSTVKLEQPLAALSSSEEYRLRLALNFSRIESPMLALLDEPSVYLAGMELRELFERLVQLGSHAITVVVADNHPEVARRSDSIVELGPGGGNAGGEIVSVRAGGSAAAAPPRLTQAERCLGHAALVGFAELRIGALTFPNLKLQGGGLYAISGAAAAGKSRLLFELLPSLLAPVLHQERQIVPEGSGVVTEIRGIKRVRSIRLWPNYAARSSVGSILGLLGPLADFMARLESARMQGLTAAQIKKSLSTPRPVQIRYRGLSLTEILNLSIADAATLLNAIPKCRRELELPLRLGLGHLGLNQEARYMGDGEKRRLNLAQNLKLAASGTLFLIERPAAGADRAEIAMLAEQFRALAELGAIVVLEESRRELLSQCTEVWELGAGSGAA